MTTILGLLLSFSLLSSPNVTGKINQSVISPAERVATDESTFTVQNATTVNVGIVNVQESDQNSVQIAVTGQGRFTAPLTASVVACSINGQPLSSGNSVRIVIDDNTSVRVTWTGNIIVVDQQEAI